MAIFDRSRYGRVLVERVEGLAPDEVWQRAYGEIVQLEQALVAEGTVMVRLWLHLSDAEQLDASDPANRTRPRRWKLTDEDCRNRDKRDDCPAAIEQMLDRTSSQHAPWTLVEAENKRWAPGSRSSTPSSTR
jgi:polyphosphate kinase 2 (PPK2 family)